MKFQLTFTISFLCLSMGFLIAWAGAQRLAHTPPNSGVVASEYNPPGRGGSYPGGTRMIEPTHDRDYT